MAGRRGTEAERREAILRAAYAVAARDRLGGVTARAVAAEAGVSSGLVFFYFESVDRLLAELLDWILAHTIVAGELVERVLPGGDDPALRMLAVVGRDVERLPRQRERVELFFDFWVLGTRDDAIRERIRAALDRYRASFLPLASAVVAAAPDRFADTDADGLAAIAAALVEGCALQIVMDPARFDADRAMRTLEALLGQKRPAGASLE